ncbi:spinster family MFS transporter [Sphingomonas tabacisoli]|uniref:Spinster family MFS transporter n=1 Tax=Sphingomonas tabacisoli TaxID=2249466 RepID=A0ABW4I2F1_9SPHN
MTVPTSAPPTPYRFYVLALLVAVALFSYIDRTIILVLQVPIKQELGLSDSEMGLLTGAAFGLFYTGFALPIGYWADRTRRTRLISLALGVWSMMTALSGFAGSLVTILLLRMGVAVGEAGTSPTTHSLLADYFPRHERGRAQAVWGISLPLGTMFGLMLGGWLSEHFGWRTTFLIVGLAGLLFVPVFLLTLREPPRGNFDAVQAEGVRPLSLGDTIAALWKIRSFRFLLAGIAFHVVAYYAFMSWSTPFYVRLHGRDLSEIAGRLGLYTGIGGLIGTFFGGILSDVLGRRDGRWALWVPMLASLLTVPFAVAQFCVDSYELSWMLAIIPSVLLNAYIAPCNATTQSLVPASTRAFANALMIMAASAFGMGIGPLLVGAISDYLMPTLGEEALRYGLIVGMLVDLIAAAAFWMGARHVGRDLNAAAEVGKEPSDDAQELPA